MKTPEVDDRLSRISTVWTMVFDAHRDNAARAASAREVLVQRYCGAIHRYLLRTVRDPHAADELVQEFALGVVRGDFHRADPEKGRFRDYVKTALFNLIRKHHRKESRQPAGLNLEVAEPAAPAEPVAADEAFVQSWRDELMARTWDALARIEKQTGQLFFTLLDYRTKHADTTSAAMAEALSGRLGKKLTAAGVRQTVHRAREKFADLLLDEVAHSLETTDADRVEQELIDLGLLAYCKDVFERRCRSQG